jgi:hypothetical protein
MPFTPKQWKDTPDTSTPLSSAALVNLEQRLGAYVDTTATTTDAMTSRTTLTRNADGTVASASDNLGRVTDQIVRGAAGITGFREAGIARTVVRDANGRIMEVT